MRVARVNYELSYIYVKLLTMQSLFNSEYVTCADSLRNTFYIYGDYINKLQKEFVKIHDYLFALT